ncbi:MAG: hypothetical protein WAK07_04115, partial [Rhodomicrobium sp.]
MTDQPNDPFLPQPIGSRPALAALWPDTRFVEFYNAKRYLADLRKEMPSFDDIGSDPAYQLVLSVQRHETIHWQILHGRSWGLMRALIAAFQPLLATRFIRTLPVPDRERAFARRREGHAILARSGVDLIINDEWSPGAHSLGEHTWACTAFTKLIDDNLFGFSKARPPEFLMGVLATYLSGRGTVEEIFDEPDGQFQKRVKSFKLKKDFSLYQEHVLFSALAIEECQAVVAQILFYSTLFQEGNAPGDALIRRFNRELWDTVIADPTGRYQSCFGCFAALAQIEDLLSAIDILGVICDLSLNPPFPFDANGEPTRDWSWEQFHPTLRFGLLAQAAIKIYKNKWPRLNKMSQGDYASLCEKLLRQSRLRIAAPDAFLKLIEPIGGKAASAQPFFPFSANFRNVCETVKLGVSHLDRSPALLIDPLGPLGEPSVEDRPRDAFLYPPFVLSDGEMIRPNDPTEDQERALAHQAFSAYHARLANNAVFG